MPIGVKTAPSNTIFGVDLSHYDGQLDRAFFVKAMAEGIAFVSHKLGEALAGEDPTQSTVLSAARDAGVQAIGGYWFLHGNVDPVAEARACVARADADEPWWRDFEGWYWQADAERSATGLPSPAHVKAFSDELARESGRVVIVYGSHGQYGDTLRNLGHPLWNANYPSGRQAPFRDLYPGDSYPGWRSYSGQTPVIAQFASSATIAGRTTCDANAFRGSLNDFLTLIGANMAAVDLTPAAQAALVEAILAAPIYQRPAGEQSDTGLSLAWGVRGAYLRSGAAGNVELPAVQATLTALQTALTPDKLGAAFVKALGGSVASGLSAAQVGAAVHEVLVADAKAVAAALSATP